MKTTRKRPGGTRRRRLRGRIRLLVSAGSVLFAAVLGLRVIPRILPWPGEEILGNLTWSHRILDRDGGELQVRPVNDAGLRRIYAGPDQIPDELRRIVRFSEDRRFYLHPGFDPLSLMRAAWGLVTGGSIETGSDRGGGSTITMQLARIILPRPPDEPVTVGRKLREIWWALQIESRLPKRRILDLYINLVPFGRNIEGFPAASRLYFGFPVEQLESAEICVLAVIPRSPAAYDPIAHPEDNLRAAALLSDTTGKRGRPEDVPAGTAFRDQARGRLLDRPAPWPFAAPHFAERVMADRESWSPDRRSGREPVPTGLDRRMQEEAERMLARRVESARAFRIGNGALILIDRVSMEIRAYAGSADFNDPDAAGQIDGARIRREPGSTLKPFLYATLIDRGWTAATVLPDIPTEFGGADTYVPGNYNQQFHGPVRLRQALAASLNVPAVYSLERLGVEQFIDILVAAGFNSLDEQRAELGVSLAVGGGEVSLTELAGGFAALASGGVYRPPVFSSADKPVEGRRIWSEAAADIITDIISTPDDRVMTFGRTGPIRFDYPAAIKTGTSNQFANIWAAGFTSDLAGAVWMGNFDGSTVMGAPGSSLPATLLHEVFDTWSLRGPLPVHAQLERRRICSLSGMTATSFCPYHVEEIFAPGTEPEACDWHISGPGGRIEVRYPQEFSYWAARYGYGLEFSDTAELDILYPPEGAVFHIDPLAPPGSQSILLRLNGSGGADLYGNGRLLYRGELPAQVHWSMEPGKVLFILARESREVRRRIEVR